MQGRDFGFSVAGAGDVNQDGFPDVIVGAPDAKPRGLVAGSALVYSGKNGERFGRIDGVRSGDRLGLYVANAGDVNQDGFPDVIAVAPGAGSTLVHGFKPAVFAYGRGLSGSGDITPQIGFAGAVPEIGSSDFTIKITDTMGGALCAIAGSLVRDEIHVFGGTLYGDFLAPETYLIRLVTTGTTGVPGTGTVSLTLNVPLHPSLVGLTTFWQCFIMDSGSPLPIEISYTRGLAVTLVR